MVRKFLIFLTFFKMFKQEAFLMNQANTKFVDEKKSMISLKLFLKVSFIKLFLEKMIINR
jgi:hypothetical protein